MLAALLANIQSRGAHTKKFHQRREETILDESVTEARMEGDAIAIPRKSLIGSAQSGPAKSGVALDGEPLDDEEEALLLILTQLGD